ncbi:hypothetical protein KVT40_003222 [Elsinoe batatas]|uniref:NB-ARC domain-containing protein n=1 Tax=Elsinoe batatas TaxID=2601811 RepID=A0A8K0PIB0_9PEZI|nr:hypothetical protein KVT40_003222 [Elsinoe batatas]
MIYANICTSPKSSLRSNWCSAVDLSSECLDRGDKRQVSRHNSWEDLEKIVAQFRRDTNRTMLGLTFPVKQLRCFYDGPLRHSLGDQDSTMSKGIIWLTVKLAIEEEEATTRVLERLRDLCQLTETFSEYIEEDRQLPPASEEPLAAAGIAIVSFCTETIMFLRNIVEFVSTGSSAESQWSPLNDAFAKSQKTIKESLSRVERLARKHSITQWSDTSGPTLSLPTHTPAATQYGGLTEDVAKLPCICLPPVQKPRFFDREDTSLAIETHYLRITEEEPLQSLALHGLGGVGKSTVALKYADSKWRKREVEALFWIHSETTTSIRQSFSRAAVKLKLPGIQAGDDEENKSLLLEWLETTERRWLLIFDNAEDVDLIRSYWPAAGRGQVLITTRNPNFAFDLAEVSIELYPWDTQTGSEFLLHLLSSNVSEQLQAGEAASAYQLSEKLSGHALAISLMAGLIHRRAWSVEEFMAVYNAHANEVKDMFGTKSIDTLWSLAFGSLDANSSALLGILCFLEPDSIPQGLFELPEIIQLPEHLTFCRSRLNFSEAVEPLLTLALVKRDRSQRTFSIHRLVQSSFKNFMTPQQRRQSFTAAGTLLAGVFPQPHPQAATLWLQWGTCATYLQHVLHLKNCFLEELTLDNSLIATLEYCVVNNSCASNNLTLGRLAHLRDDYETAEAYYMAAQNAWLKGDQLRSSAFNGSCMYRLGCLALDEGKVEASIKHLRDALVVTSKRKDILVPEHARVLFKLSEALEQEKGEERQAQSLREEAERMLRQRVPDTKDAGRIETYDNLVGVMWR